MITIEVRPPDVAELRAAGRLTVAAYLADGHLEPGDDYGDWLGDTEGRARDVLVATAGDEVLGVLTWCPPGSPHREVARSDDEGEFIWLCSLSTMTKAHRLYESMGFRRVPERDWVPDDAPDLVLLAFCREL